METKAVAVQNKVGMPVVLMPQSMSDVMQAADFLSKSALIPSALRGKPADVAIIVMTGMELGIGPMQALQNIAVVNGKPTAEGKLLLALIQSRCPEAGIEIQSEPTKAVVKMTRGKNSYTATWDTARARTLGLMDKPNYKSQPGTMLKWRAVADAARTLFSDVVLGILTNDEAEDIRETKEVESTVTDKVARLAAKVEPAIEVQSEVLPAQDTTEADSFNPVADYVIQAECPLKGKKLSEVDPGTLANFAHAVRAKSEKTGKVIDGVWLETITRIEQFLTPPVGGEAYFNAPEEGMFQ